MIQFDFTRLHLHPAPARILPLDVKFYAGGIPVSIRPGWPVRIKHENWLTHLSDLGYEILEAEDAKDALEVMDNSSRINLLFTDVVLPGGMSGLEFVAEVRDRRPGFAVLFTSGYSEESILGHPDIVRWAYPSILARLRAHILHDCYWLDR